MRMGLHTENVTIIKIQQMGYLYIIREKYSLNMGIK
jgi:hypothetical protein